MSRFRNELHTLTIFNDHAFAQPGNPRSEVWIGYVPEDRGRGGHSASWVVCRLGYKTAPNSPWYDYGNKHFHVYGRAERAAKLEEAKQWCAKRYKIKDWERTPFGGLMDASFVKERVAYLTKCLREKSRAV